MKKQFSILIMLGFIVLAGLIAFAQTSSPVSEHNAAPLARQDDSLELLSTEHADVAVEPQSDYWSLIFVFVLATFIGIGVIARVSRLLHTPLMSITNAISAIAVVGSIIVTGSDYPTDIRILGAIALFASMTNIVSGFLITQRMLKMFKEERKTEAKS